ILRYDDHDGNGKPRPALVERTVGNGRVLMFTTPLDPNWDANNIWKASSFGLVLVDQVCRYLTGEMLADDVNFVCGLPVAVPLVLAVESVLANKFYKREPVAPETGSSTDGVESRAAVEAPVGASSVSR